MTAVRRPRQQRGLLLLPVVLALAVMASLAFAMSRGGAHDANAVDAQYDAEATRYLAEAGLRLAKWQNEKLGCDSERRFSAVRLPGAGGTISVTALKVKDDEFSATVSASSGRGAVSEQSGEKMRFYDRTRLYNAAIKESDFKDTWIGSASPNQSYGSSSSLTTSDGSAHILLGIQGFPKDSRVTRATLWLYLNGSNSVQTVRQLAAHAVTRPWTDGSASWVAPWNTTPGGSYEARPEITTSIGAVNGYHGWELGALVRRWQTNALPNNGVLFKPLGLNAASFNSKEAPTNRPRMDISYHLRCD